MSKPDGRRDRSATPTDGGVQRQSTAERTLSAMSGWVATGAASSAARAGRRSSKPPERKPPESEHQVHATYRGKRYLETVGDLQLHSHEPTLFKQKQQKHRDTSAPPGIEGMRKQHQRSAESSWSIYSTFTTDHDISFSSKGSRSRLSSISSGSQDSKDSYTRPPRRISKEQRDDFSLSPDSHGTQYSTSPSQPSAYAASAAVKPEDPKDSDPTSGKTPPLDTPPIVRHFYL